MLAVDAAADHFYLFFVADGFGTDGFGLGVVENAEGDLGGVALVFVPGKGELFVPDADTFSIVQEADMTLVGMVESGYGVSDFYDVVDGTIFEREGVEPFEKAGGNDGGGATGKATTGGAEKIAGVFGKIFEVFEGVLFLEPARVADGTPVGKVLIVDGRAVELGGKDALDGGERVQPGEDLRGGLVIVEAAVEFFADHFGEAGDFAEQCPF